MRHSWNCGIRFVPIISLLTRTDKPQVILRLQGRYVVFQQPEQQGARVGKKLNDINN